MKETKKFMTYQDMCELINDLDDYRDKILIMLIFDGFYTDLDSIQHLRAKDIRDSHYKYLGDRRISGATLRVIRKGLEETQIHTFSKINNGVDNLIPSDYILRERQGCITRFKEGTFNGYSMNRDAIINRFYRLKKKHGFKFTMSSLYGSGVIHRSLDKMGRITTNKPRVEFLKHLKETEGVQEGMGYLYYKELLRMYPHIKRGEE